MARVAALVLLVVVLALLGSSQDVNAKKGGQDEKKLASSLKKLQEQMKRATKKLEKFKTLQGGMKALGTSQKKMTKRADKLENKLKGLGKLIKNLKAVAKNGRINQKRLQFIEAAMKGISSAAKIKGQKKATIAKESATSEATSILGVRLKGKLLAKNKAAQARNKTKPISAKARDTTVPHTDVLPRKRRSLLGGKGLFKNHHKIGESMKLKFSAMKKRHQERMASMKKKLSDLEYDDGDYGSGEDMEAGKVDEEVLDLGEDKDKGKSVKRSPKKIFQGLIHRRSDENDLEYDDGDYGSGEDMEAGKVDEEVLDLGEDKDKGKSVKRSPKKIFQVMKERLHKRMTWMKKKISDFKQKAASNLAGMRSKFEGLLSTEM